MICPRLAMVVRPGDNSLTLLQHFSRENFLVASLRRRQSGSFRHRHGYRRILIDVEDNAGDGLGVRFEDIGELMLKNIYSMVRCIESIGARVSAAGRINPRIQPAEGMPLAAFRISTSCGSTNSDGPP